MDTNEENVDDAALEANGAQAPAAGAGGETGADGEAGGEPLSSKERRRRARERRAQGARRARTPEERAAERRRRARVRRSWRARVRERRAEPGPAHERAPAPAERPTGRPRQRQGVVVSDKADKTITVRIDVARRHRRYGKIIRTSTTLHAHDERNEARAGDTVRVVESRPRSRTKRWRLVEVLERAE